MDQYRTIEGELKRSKQRIAELEVELQACADKLEVYQRTGATVSHAEWDGGRGRLPDDGKSNEELKRELMQLREVYSRDRGEMERVRLGCLTAWICTSC